MPSHNFGSFVFTPVVQALQERYGSRRQYAKLEKAARAPDTLGRLKILGRAEILEGEHAAALIERVRDPHYKAVVERVFVIHLDAFDWNCPEHITPRYTAEDIQAAIAPVEQDLQRLQQENERLRKQLSNRSDV